MLWDMRYVEFLEAYSSINKCWDGELTFSQALWSIHTLLADSGFSAFTIWRRHVSYNLRYSRPA